MAKPAIAALGFLASVLLGIQTAVPAEAKQSPAAGAFAVIDGESVSQADFETFLAGYLRRKLFHGGSPERLMELGREAAQALVEQRLVVHEAERRAIPGDVEAVNRQIAAIEDQYKATADWAGLEGQLPAIRQSLLEQTKIDMLQADVMRVADPSDAELLSYYQQNPALFTEPERMRLSVILIGVEPSATADEWAAARAKADGLFQALQQGGDFAALAAKSSTHSSAAAGGDLGEVHRGQLSDTAQAAVDRLQPEQISPPVRVLEGYTLFRLHARIKPEVSSFAAVHERAAELYRRDTAQRQWDELVAGLRAKASVAVDESLMKAVIDGVNNLE